MIRHKKLLIISLSVLMAIAITTLLILRSRGVFISEYAIWNNYSEEYTIGNEHVTFTLKNKKLSICEAENSANLLYQSDKGVYVSDVFCRDIDRDGSPEVVMLTWKRGSYGEHKPIWIEEDTKDFTQHLFIYDWDSQRSDRLDPLWMSSALGIRVQDISIDNRGRIHFIDTSHKETVWEWGSWGLIEAD